MTNLVIITVIVYMILAVILLLWLIKYTKKNGVLHKMHSLLSDNHATLTKLRPMINEEREYFDKKPDK